MIGISVVQNFICNIPERLELVKNNTPVVGEVWGDYEFFVNFNDEDNFEEVYSIYEEHIPKLNFYNNLEKDWARVTLALVEEVETSHVVFLNEDQEFFMTKEDWSNIINEAIIENDVDYILMNKIDKYNKKAYVNGELENPDDPSSMIIKMLWDKYPSPGYKEGKHVYFYDGKYAPHKRISVEAVYRTEWFVDRLKEFIQNENIVKDKDLVIMNNHDQPIDIPFKKKNLCNFYEGYYDFYNGMARFPDMKCAMAKSDITKQWNEIKQK